MCTLLAAIIIAFVYGWQLTLLILSCIPFLIGANFIRMKSMAGHASKDQKALEEAGRVSQFNCQNVIENVLEMANSALNLFYV